MQQRPAKLLLVRLHKSLFHDVTADNPARALHVFFIVRSADLRKERRIIRTFRVRYFYFVTLFEREHRTTLNYSDFCIQKPRESSGL